MGICMHELRGDRALVGLESVPRSRPVLVDESRVGGAEDHNPRERFQADCE
jgi:hypothetical protein